jgi:oxygen-independent coproporphyrinogen-3 oxidase
VDGVRRATETLRDPAAWLSAVGQAGHGVTLDAPLSSADQGTEYLLMAMRLVEGADLARHARLAGAPLPAGRIAALEADGLVRVAEGRIAATDGGRLVLNGILGNLLA